MKNWFEAMIEEKPEGLPARPEGRAVLYCKTQTIRAGELTEVRCYPVYVSAYRQRIARCRPTTQAVRTVNDRRSRDRFRWYAETNFKAGRDYLLTLTYADAAQLTEEQCRKDYRNYIARVNRARAKKGLDHARHMGVIQVGTVNGRLHHHILIEGGLDRDEMERLWGKGYANCDRIQRGKGGLTAACRYITRGFTGERAKGRHRYSYSRNLKKPRVTESRTRISVRQAERIREDADRDGAEIIRRKWPGMVLEQLTVRQSEWMPGAYIVAELRRSSP